MNDMRKIKFRAWNKNEKCFFYWDTSFAFGGTGKVWGDIEQFTGLCDKNGKEIYENDFCSISNPYNNCTASGFAKVVFSYGYVGGWVLTSDGKDYLNIGTRTKSIEVVGNMHENPDTAKQDAERNP
jgi:hypothetical protein